jgi:Raf kinase inhibitor-like YbhB/YbcL family protein
VPFAHFLGMLATAAMTTPDTLGTWRGLIRTTVRGLGAAAAALVATLVLGGCARSEAAPEGRDAAAPIAPASAVTTAKMEPDSLGSGAKAMQTLTLTSTAFTHQGAMPAKHTCEGPNLSPPLTLGSVPSGTKSLALVVEDPDAPDPAAPKTTWSHWVLYDLPPDTRALPEGAGNGKSPGRAGKNDWGSTGYRGPCPPVGRHRYFFKVFALDTELGELGEPTRAGVLKATAGHVLAQGELVGTYQKAK